MKGISRNIKTGIVLVIILVFVGSVVKVILDGYKGKLLKNQANFV